MTRPGSAERWTCFGGAGRPDRAVTTGILAIARAGRAAAIKVHDAGPGPRRPRSTGAGRCRSGDGRPSPVGRRPASARPTEPIPPPPHPIAGPPADVRSVAPWAATGQTSGLGPEAPAPPIHPTVPRPWSGGARGLRPSPSYTTTAAAPPPSNSTLLAPGPDPTTPPGLSPDASPPGRRPPHPTKDPPRPRPPRPAAPPHPAPAGASALPRNEIELERGGRSRPHPDLAASELPGRARCHRGISRRGRVGGHRRPHDGGGHRDGDQGQDQQLLAPLAAEQPPGPADHRAPGGNAPVPGAPAGAGRSGAAVLTESDPA